MIKRVIIVVFVLISLFGVFYGLYHFKKIKQPVSDPYLAVPSSAAFIMECKNGHGIWEELSNTNIMWDALQITESCRELNQTLILIDTLYNRFSMVRDIIDNQPIILSAHMTGATNFFFLTTFSLPAGTDGKTVVSFITEMVSKAFSMTKKDFEGAEIYQINPLGYAFTIYKNIFSGSYNQSLVELAVKQSNTDKTLSSDEIFKKIVTTSGKSQEANVYINIKQFNKLLKTYASEEVDGFFHWLQNFSDWFELDFKLRPNYLMLNGFTFSNDTLNNYLNIFKEQKTQPIEITKIIPHTTCFVHSIALSDVPLFYENYKNHLSKEDRINHRLRLIQHFNDSFKTTIEEEVFSWVGNEIALVITEPADSSLLAQNSFGILKIAYSDSATSSLDRLMKKSGKPDTTTYRGFTITQLQMPPFLNLLFGDMFNLITKNYFTIIENYVVFGNSEESLKEFISYYYSGRKLKDDENYSEFASKHLYDESNLFIYCNIARSLNLFKAFANERYLSDISTHANLFKQFQAAAIQISADKNGLFYNNLILKHNPITKKEATSLWETFLPASIAMKPAMPINHYTGSPEIFVQDDSNKVYLIGNTGKILWERQLNEPILGNVQQIDIFGNKKLQLLFNTAKKLHLIDRNGQDVTGFPVLLKTDATAPLTLVDYDNDFNYRILIPLSDKTIQNYDKHGKRVSGWSSETLKQEVVRPLQYFKIGSKDYITGVDLAGNVYVMDRRGESRLTITSKFQLSANNDFFIEKGNSLSKTRLISTDSTGTVHSLFLDDKMASTTLNLFSSEHFFGFSDINSDNSGEFIFADKHKLFVYTQDKELLFTHEFDSVITLPPQFYSFSSGNRIGVTSTLTNEVFLFDEKGAIKEGFPLSGSTLFSIGDINKDGVFNLIVGSKNRIVYTYNIQ